MCSLFNSRLPLRTSETMLAVPNTFTRSFCLSSCWSIKKRKASKGLASWQTITRFLEVLDQEREELSQFFFGGGEILAAAVELVEDFGVCLVLLLGADDFGRDFSKERCVLRSGDQGKSYGPISFAVLSDEFSTWRKKIFCVR